MKSILKKITPSFHLAQSSPSFEDYLDERIRIMQNSADEYLTFIRLLDDVITRIDFTMDNTRIEHKKKSVRFSEKNEVFLIPPRNKSPLSGSISIDKSLDNLFPDLFYQPFP